MRVIRWLAFFLLVCLLVAGAIVYFQWKQFLSTPVNLTEKAFVFQIKRGQSIRQIAFALKKQNRMSSPRFFTWLVRLKGASHRIHAGDYIVTPGITPVQLIDKMISGEVVFQRITLVDGWTFSQFMKKINESPHLSHTLTHLSSEEIMKKLDAEGISPEGRFYPDTYLFRQGELDVNILKQAYQKMQKIIEQSWKMREPSIPYRTAGEALIAASIIQKETHFVDEYPKVSSVIRNRLNQHMLLQMDPTVIYGLKERYVYPLTKKQLTVDTPYNTYRHKGLPPTPISMVNIRALHAALHPKPSDDLYFVVNETGRHTFSSHFDAHLDAVNLFRKKQQKKSSQPWVGEVCIWVGGFAFYDQK